MHISSLEIDSNLKELLISDGYSELYPSQELSIEKGLLEGQNLLVCTPTASGKTLIAKIASGKVLMNNKKVVYICPLRALAYEKYEDFKNLQTLTKSNGQKINVRISTGDFDSSGEKLNRSDFLILTYEKFDSLIRHGLSWFNEIGLFVIDEIHGLGSANRGSTLEMIIANILNHNPAQIIGLSATITNSKEISDWLSAKRVISNWRPVDLDEGIYSYNQIEFESGNIRKITEGSMDSSVDISIDSINDGGQALVFAESRRRAVSITQKISKIMSKGNKDSELSEISKKIKNSGEPSELSEKLSRFIMNGVAFHHAGLKHSHRKIVEDGFKSKLIKILVSTPTLAAGVNLPARRVVISSLFRYDPLTSSRKPIDILEYKQMCGRAGRPNYDDKGETVLIAASDFEASNVRDYYIYGEPEPIESQLLKTSNFNSHLLALISSTPGISLTNIENLFTKTLAFKQTSTEEISAAISMSIDFLNSEELIVFKQGKYISTKFGRRISQLYISPETGVYFRNELLKMNNVDFKTIGILYLITSSPDFYPKFTIRNKDFDNCVSFVLQNKSQFYHQNIESEYLLSNFLGPVRTTILMNYWIGETSEKDILSNLDIQPGDLHRAIESAVWMSYSLFEICKIIKRSDLFNDLELLQKRIENGIKSELVPIVKLKSIGRVRSRNLFKNGYTTLEKINQTSISDLSQVPTIGLSIAENIKNQLN